LVPVLFRFYIQGVLKLKKNNSGAKRLIMHDRYSVILQNVYVEVTPITCPCRHRGEAEVQLQPIHNPALGGWWSAPHSGCFIPTKDSLPIVQEAESYSGLVWIGTENLVPTGI